MQIARDESELGPEFETAVQSYVEAFGVTRETAVTRLLKQDALSELARRLGQRDDVVQSGVRHRADGIEIVLVVSPGRANGGADRFVAEQAEELGIEISTVVVEGPAAKGRIEAARHAIEARMDETVHGPWSVSVDAFTGELRLRAGASVVDEATEAARSVLASLGMADVPKLVGAVEITDEVDANQAGGGERLVTSSGQCTSGFAVRATAGPAIMTAGHCGDLSASLVDTSGAGSTATSVELDDASLDGYLSGRDTQFHRLRVADNAIADPSIVISSTNERTAIRNVLVPGNGVWICQFGRTTNVTSCGSVINNNYTSSSSGEPTLYGMIQSEANGDHGDSGGPVYVGDRAVGTISRVKDCVTVPWQAGCVFYNETIIQPIGSGLAGTGYTLLGAGDSARFTPLAPARIYDSRQGDAKIYGGLTVLVDVRGNGGVPTSENVIAAVLNVTTVNPSAAGHINVYANGTAPPVASSGNFPANSQRAHNVTVALTNIAGEIRIYSSVTTDVVVDVLGYYRTDSGANRATILSAPVRALDTRDINGYSIPLPPNGYRDVTIPYPVPDSASAVIVNVTLVSPTAATFVAVDHPSGTNPPVHSSVNAGAGEVVANMTISRALDAGASAQIRVRNGPGQTHVIVDVLGYFSASTSTSAYLYAPLQPTRLVDTRTGLNASGKIGPGQLRTFRMANVASSPLVPTNAKGVVVRVIAVGPTEAGHYLVSQLGSTATSTLNFVAGVTTSNTAAVLLQSDGDLVVWNSHGQSDVVIDIEGYFYYG